MGAARTGLWVLQALLLVSYLALAAAMPSAVAGEAGEQSLTITVQVPEGVEGYRVWAEEGSLFYSWTSRLDVPSNAQPPEGGGVAQALLRVYPGLLEASLSASGSALLGDSRVELALTGSGRGGAVEEGSFEFSAEGSIGSGDARVSLELSLAADATGFELRVSMKPETPSSLPLFAAASGLASQLLKNLADSLEQQGFNTTVSEERRLSGYTAVLTATAGEGASGVEAATGLLGLGGPTAPLAVALSMKEPSLLVNEPVVVESSTIVFTGGEEASVKVSASASSTVLSFTSASYDAEASEASLTISASPPLLSGVKSALCSVGAVECGEADPGPLTGSFRAVEVAMLDHIVVADNGFLEIVGGAQALKQLTIEAQGLRITLPEGERASLLGVDLRGGKPLVYGGFTRITLEAGEPFVALGPGYRVEAEEASDGVYVATIHGPASIAIAPPGEAEAGAPEPVTVTVVETTTLRETLTETVTETVTETTTVTLTLRELVTTTKEGGVPVSTAAIAGALIAIAAPVVAYLLLVRGR